MTQQHKIPNDTPGLERLYARTLALMEEERAITRALDWVEQVLPAIAPACRLAVHQGDTEILHTWLAWVASEQATRLEEAGKGEVFAWRRLWLRRLLATAQMLLERRPESREPLDALAVALHNSHPELPACFPCAFWYDLLHYLCPLSEDSQAATASEPSDTGGKRSSRISTGIRRISFPLILTEPVIDNGNETNVILAEWLLSPASRSTGGVFLHPEQAALRCMDARFAQVFAQAGQVARQALEAKATALPDVRVRLQTARPGHERFLNGILLRGASGAGALAVGLHSLYTHQSCCDSDFAVTFALSPATSEEPNGRCYAIGGADDKVRGCARQGVKRLLVARDQQESLALYGYKHGIEVLGAQTFTEAVACVARQSESRPQPKSPSPQKIVLLYSRHAPSDAHVSALLEARWTAQGHQVFVDRNLPVGIAWAQEIERQIREADAVVALLSETSVSSEMFAGEVETASEARQERGDKPRLLPVRVRYDGPLPEHLAHFLAPLQQTTWDSPEDDARLLADLSHSLSRPEPPPILPVAVAPRSSGGVLEDMEPFDGPVPLSSRFYVVREVDAEFSKAIFQRHSVVLIKGSRQAGKSSLLARGLHLAQETEARVAVTDFQKLSIEDLRSAEAFYCALARMLARQLKIGVALEDIWTPGRSANLNFEEYMEDYVLPKASPLVWGIDEADRLFFAGHFSSDVFGLFRSWANEHQSRATSPWANLTLIIAYATESHLFIPDVDQSPFNIGTRFELSDFTVHEVADLNERYGAPLRDDLELARFYYLVGGHPYLVRRGLYSLTRDGGGIDTFEVAAAREGGPIGDHLRRILVLLSRHPGHTQAVQQMLQGKRCPSQEIFYHLRSAGVLTGDTLQDARFRCHLYRSFLESHLSEGSSASGES